MFTRLKTALLIGLTMLFASSVFAFIPRSTFGPEKLLSSVQNVTEQTDSPSENRVGDFSERTPIRTGLFTVQAYGMPWVVQGTVYKTASGRYILFFVDPYGLCAEQGGFSQWVDNAAWAASEWKTGIGEALYNLPQNTWNTIAHPIQTVKNIPAGLSSAWDTMKSGDYGATGRLMGNLTGNVEVGLAVGGAVKGLSSRGAGIKYIGKLDDLDGVPRAQTLLDDLPDLGNPRANYYQNSSVLRGAVRDGYQIRDASVYRPNWSPDPTLLRPDRTIGQSFLGAERLIMDNKGFVPSSGGTYIPR